MKKDVLLLSCTLVGGVPFEGLRMDCFQRTMVTFPYLEQGQSAETIFPTLYKNQTYVTAVIKYNLRVFRDQTNRKSSRIPLPAHYGST